MSYQVLARKWRPRTFDAVVGQDAITRTLRNALASGRIAHAYLFAGPRGVGKTTTARLLARALLCPERTGPEACGTCAVCTDPQSVDVIEIDGASNRRIDDVRALRDNVRYAPSRGRYKVYIIDEVHQLTAEAFDALLKTLEEPPAHVVFIFATTDPRDLPPTILSRVQRFDFRPIPAELLAATLERVLTEEGVPFEPGALPTVVRAAEGSLRDALSLVDTAIAYGNGRLEAATTATLLGVTAPSEVRAFATALVAHETAAALEAIDRAVREGDDLHAFMRDVIEMLRLALVLKAGPATKLPDLTPAEADELRGLGAPVSLDELLYIVRAFLEADALMRESPHPRVELEIAAVRATRRPVPQALETVLRRVEEAEARWRSQPPAAGAPAVVQESLLPLAADPPAPRRPAPAALPVADAPPPRREAAAPAPPAPPAELAAAWERVVEEVMKKKPTLAGVLAHARPLGVRDRALTVALTGNHFHREMLADGANRELVADAIRRVVPGAERLDVTAGGEETDSATAHPAVQAVVAGLQGEVVAVRPRLPEGGGQ